MLSAGMGNREVLEQTEQGYRIPCPALVPSSMYDMLLTCWDRMPEKRPTFEFLYSYFDDFFVQTEPNYKDANDI